MTVTMTGEKTAVLVDGAFYRRRAYHLFGDKGPKDRANELIDYCMRHLTNGGYRNSLYRIFYYDCPPMDGNLYHPLLQKAIPMKNTKTYAWANEFFNELASKRKVALRMGILQEKESGYRVKPEAVNKLCRREITVDDLTENDFIPNFVQKGVDMRIGIDIVMLAMKRQVSQIVLIAGDSDFVPAAKQARREGIDFVLDPMWQKIKPELNEHIDGLRSCTSNHPDPNSEKLHASYHEKGCEGECGKPKKERNGSKRHVVRR